jgi:hypothetical protein
MDPISIALGLAQFIPSLVRWIGGDDAGRVAEKVVATAREVTGGAADPVAALARDPAAVERLQAAWAAQELALYQAETERLLAINETIRAEAAGGDVFARRWRPTWGYVTALCWLLQTLAIVVALCGATLATLRGSAAEAQALLSGAAALAGALTVQWSVALAVLGVAVQARSADKRLAAGVEAPPGLLATLMQRVAGR